MAPSDVLQRFGELPFGVELELGTLALTIREIFELQEGTVLKTEHAAGAPFPLFAGGVPLAEAEVVVVNERVSVRVQKILEDRPAAGG